MPSTVVQMNVATRTLVTEKLISKCIPSAIFVDNVHGASDADLVFNDVFTPSVTNNVVFPTPQTIPRLHINVAAGECISTMDFIKPDLEFLGNVQVVVNGGVALPLCYVSFIYNFAKY
ncbi:MAG: hypothetical protein PHI12_06935 [Dehalococcoidales bacterium]|nr:hypothetical protein [Dehalococcoidales bacterium]